MGWLGATLKQVFTRARRVDVSLRDVTIARDGKRGYTVRMTSRTRRARRIWGDFEKVSELRTGHRTRRLTFACSQRSLWRVPRVLGVCVWGGDEKARIERLCLSPYVEEPLNSKVIKRFVPEQRSRHVFFAFRDPMFYVYMYEHPIYISLWYSQTKKKKKGCSNSILNHKSIGNTKKQNSDVELSV